MNQAASKSVVIRDLETLAELEQAEAVEKEVWRLDDLMSPR